MIEDIYTEFKQLWRDEYIRYISAFCNTKGGVLYVGIDDKGEIVGVDNAIFLLENLPNIINSKTGIMPLIELIDKEDKQYISITVQPSVVPISYNGHYYTRSGSVTTELHGSRLNTFLLQKMGFTWESMIEDKFTIDDIDNNAIAKFKSLAVERIPLINTENDTLKLIDKLQLTTDNKFKKAAVLLFAKDTQRFYLQARIRIGKFLSASDIQTSDIIEGNIFEQVFKTLDVLKTKYLLSTISYEGIVRKEILEYPYEALREAILNAIIHREYFTTSEIQIRVFKDKLVILNEAKLSKEITVDNLMESHPSKPYNKLIAEVFYKAGLIESWGRGTQRIVEECEKANLPIPKFEYKDGTFYVIFFKRNYEKENVTENVTENREALIIKLITENENITTTEIAKILNVVRRTVARDIENLKAKGIINRIGSDKGGYWKVNDK